MDVVHFLFFVLATLAFVLAQWLFLTWYGGYRNPIEFYYHEINKNPKAGAWYYGGAQAAKQRGGSLKWNLKRRYPTTISGLPDDD